MDTVPSPVRRIIYGWLDEFNRADMIERYTVARTIFTEPMRFICEDIKTNTPVYTFNILTQSHAHMRLSISLPDCNPTRVRTGLRIPESHIVSWARRSRSVIPLVILTPTTQISAQRTILDTIILSTD
jgi:hypothetical protein